jgi:hypothetical protein
MDERVISFHESGHAIAAIAFNRPVFSMSIGPDGGETRETAPSPALELAECAGPDAENRLFEVVVKATLSPTDAERQWPRLVGLLAGRASQRMIAGPEFDHYAEGDMHQARVIAGAITETTSQADALLREAEMMAISVVTNEWTKIEALAAELLVRRKLDAAQIRAVIQVASLGPAARRRRAWEQHTAGAQAFALAVRG